MMMMMILFENDSRGYTMMPGRSEGCFDKDHVLHTIIVCFYCCWAVTTTHIAIMLLLLLLLLLLLHRGLVVAG